MVEEVCVQDLSKVELNILNEITPSTFLQRCLTNACQLMEEPESLLRPAPRVLTVNQVTGLVEDKRHSWGDQGGRLCIFP